MTFRQALDQRIRFVRLPEWEPSAHLELPLVPLDKCGPWVICRDVSRTTPIFIFDLLNDPTDRFEEFMV